jgi:hypothetical protein
MKNIPDHSNYNDNYLWEFGQTWQESLGKERHKVCGFEYFDNNHKCFRTMAWSAFTKIDTKSMVIETQGNEGKVH